ncbi:hypothetical protein KL909_003487 [Ogataea angusta]|nr:hypothetical protein KL909_003487 [Ogataea angusta]KAG7833083.1 hypothetical protein KL943_004531 [Ogataea angusta]KAG7843817.1 hypothetical protein KL941_004299 [Ogataea angusta]
MITMSRGLSIEERLERLKKLKLLKEHALEENEKELQREIRQLKEEQKLRAAAARKDVEEIETEPQNQGANCERLRNLRYTIEQDEAWHEKLEAGKTAAEDREFQNFKQLARQTYTKGLKNLNPLDPEQYEAQKQIYFEMKKEGKSDSEIINSLTSRERLNQMVDQLKERETTTVKRRKTAQDRQNFINDKNKQFNDKLDRHYDEYLSDLKESIQRGSSL